MPEGTPEFLAALDLVTGVSVDGRTLVATVLADTSAGSTQLQLRYSGNGDFDNPNDCLMGGLPFNERDDSGCKSIIYCSLWPSHLHFILFRD